MIRVLICDDDMLFLQKMKAETECLFSKADIKAKIHAYSCREEIGAPILTSCDIAFLDIDFTNKQYNGLDIARQLRALRQDAIIIFVTNYIEYAPDGYEVQAFRYMLKSDLDAKLESYIKLAIEHLATSRKTLKIQVNGELIDIPINNILYVEAQLHTVIVNVQKDRLGKNIKQYQYYSSLSAVEKQLEPLGFLRVHKGFLVNMNKIKKFQCHEVVLSNGCSLRVSEKNYAKQKEKYLLWKGR